MVKKAIGGLLAIITGLVFFLALLTLPANAHRSQHVNGWFEEFRLLAIPLVLFLSCALLWKLDPWEGRASVMPGLRLIVTRLHKRAQTLSNTRKIPGSGITGLVPGGTIAFYAGRLYQQRVRLDNELFLNSMTLRLVEPGKTNKVSAFRARDQECIRMLNGMERTLEKLLPESGRRWPNACVREDTGSDDACPCGFPEPPLPVP